MTAQKPTWTSMTGYAQADFELAGRHFKFQVKSVNHRYFEFRMRAPREWQMLENDIRALCKDALQRGSLDFWIEEARGHGAARRGEDLDFSRVKLFVSKLSKTLQATQGEWGASWIPEAVKALILARHSELWDREEDEGRSAELQISPEDLAPCVRQLCQKLLEQRQTEGLQTREAVEAHAAFIRSQWAKVAEDLPRLKESWQKGLEERLQKLSEAFSGVSVDSQRVYQEFLMLADRRDVSEEIQRIDAHLKALEDLIEAPRENSVGKRLDFLAQELNREWTTLSNKIQDPALNQRVGEAKLTIEKIREQSLNLV